MFLQNNILSHFNNSIDKVETQLILLALAILWDSLHDLEVVTLEPLIAEKDGLGAIHLNEASDVFEDKLLHLDIGTVTVISHHNIGLDIL